jgi:hypothetical protein
MIERMVTTDEFTITEDGFRAVIETVYGLNQAVAELSRSVEAANEALVIMAHEITDLREHQSRGYVPAGWDN